LQAPIAILSVFVRQTGGLLVGKNDIGTGTDTDFIVACTAAFTNVMVRMKIVFLK
jgi:hypothetical protein